MSAPQPTAGEPDGADRQLDPMDELEFSAHDLALFTRVVTLFADDFLEEFRGPLMWKVEALAMLCKKTGKMAQRLCQTAEKARRHAP